MHVHHNPADVVKPFSAYAQGVEVAPGARWLHVSGQVGARPDGGTPDGFEGQCEQAFRNLLNMVKAAGMGATDLVKITAFLTRAEDIPAYRAIRDRMLGEARTASTLVLVAGLASPRWLVEIEGVAAKG